MDVNKTNNNIYKSFAEFMQYRKNMFNENTYSPEIHGIINEDGDGKIDAPDNINSEKEWEYFCIHYTNYPKTALLVDKSFDPAKGDENVHIAYCKMFIAAIKSSNDPAKINTYSIRIGGILNIMKEHYNVKGEKNEMLLKSIIPLFALKDPYPVISFLYPFIIGLLRDRSLSQSFKSEFYPQYIQATSPEKKALIERVSITSSINADTIKIEYKNGVTAYVDDVDLIWSFNDTLCKTIISIPEGFFESVNNISLKSSDFKSPNEADYSGFYKKDRSIIINGSGDYYKTIIHELAHHWDLFLEKGIISISNIYRSISWKESILGWRPKSEHFDADFNDDMEYGKTNEKEDIAVFTEHYVISAQSLREFVREQMGKGNFNPALKYLFVKYLMPFYGREYSLTSDNSAITFEEVHEKLYESLLKNSSKIPNSVIYTLNKIEKHASRK